MYHYKLAHFNPKELDELDSWQGGRTDIHPGYDLRHLGGVEELLSNPSNEKKIMKEYERHAKGGQVGELLRQADHMRHRGRNGDSEMAIIGPNTERVFNRLLNGGSVNPHTGKPEYFNLGGFLGGVGKTLSKGFNKVGSTLGQGVNNIMQSKQVQGLPGMIGKALPGAIQGGMMGGPEGAALGGVSSLLGQMGGGSQAPQSLGGLGQTFMNSPMGQQALGSQYGQMAQNYGGLAQNAYSQGQNFMNSRAGQALQNSPIGQRAQQAINPYMQQMQQGKQQGQQMYNQANQRFGNAMRQGNGYNQQAQQGPNNNQAYAQDDQHGMFDMGGHNMFAEQPQQQAQPPRQGGRQNRKQGMFDVGGQNMFGQ